MNVNADKGKVRYIGKGKGEDDDEGKGILKANGKGEY